ncbi:hypothetical protein EOL96_02530 [Candidatus Saccharibacteria bacterium]|nr:hypothetical protein [Candidatus Saccharibacteria bacterium]
MSEQASAGGASHRESTFPNYEFPLAPESVRSAYAEYWKGTTEPPSVLAAKQLAMGTTNTLIADFCDDYLTPQTYHAAMLGEQFDGLNDPQNARRAERSLGIYRSRSQEPKENQRFVFSLLSDRLVIRDFWQKHTLDTYAQDSSRRALFMDSDNSLPVSREAWWRRALGTRATDILKIRSEHGVNIESLLIGSAETLQWLHSDQAQNNSETYQRIHKAKTLYAPLDEIIGFDGMGMALQSRSELLRIGFSGRADIVALAQVIVEMMGDPSAIEERTQFMLESVLGENIHEQVLTHAASHGIVIGEGRCTKDALRVVWRAKTVGGVARKLCKFGLDNLPPEIIENMIAQPPERLIYELLAWKKMPHDIIAATILTQTPEQVGRELRAILQKASRDQRITLSPSPSRSKPVHVKGSADYVKAVGSGMGYSGIEEMKLYVDVEPGEYRVGKVTFRFQRWGEPLPLPVELQFNTEADRVEGRIGSASHAQYRLAEGKPYYLGPDDTAALADFHAQKMHLGQNGLTPISRTRADALITDINTRLS